MLYCLSHCVQDDEYYYYYDDEYEDEDEPEQKSQRQLLNPYARNILSVLKRGRHGPERPGTRPDRSYVAAKARNGRDSHQQRNTHVTVSLLSVLQ